jgi:hypothetical protein
MLATFSLPRYSLQARLLNVFSGLASRSSSLKRRIWHGPDHCKVCKFFFLLPGRVGAGQRKQNLQAVITVLQAQRAAMLFRDIARNGKSKPGAAGFA